MSDLSRLLDDVYGGPEAPVGVTPPAPAAALVGLPDWAMDAALDDAFADLVPGPVTAPVAAAAPVDAPIDHLERALGEPATSPFSDEATQPAAVGGVEAAADWCRADDDILPAGRTKVSKRGRPSAVAGGAVPVIEMFAASEDQAPTRRGRLQRHKR